jgi:hypothetical protein
MSLAMKLSMLVPQLPQLEYHVLLPLKLCGFFCCLSLTTPLHLTSSTSCIRLDGFEPSRL